MIIWLGSCDFLRATLFSFLLRQVAFIGFDLLDERNFVIVVNVLEVDETLQHHRLFVVQSIEGVEEYKGLNNWMMLD